MTDVFAGVFLAEVQGEGVLLDLVGDRYVGLGAISTRLWRELAAGASADVAARALATDHALDPGTARDVVERQLEAWRAEDLLRTAAPGLPVPRVGASIGALDDAAVTATPLRLAAVAAIAWSAVWVTASLATRGPAPTVAALQALPVESADPRRAIPLRRAQIWLRRWFHQGRDDCWPRSLVLARALRRAGIDAQVCVGVRKFPFLAHAWVEVGGTAVNDARALLDLLVTIARF